MDVLNRMEATDSKQLMEALGMEDPMLAEEIKKNMFLFSDIVMLDNRSVQQVLRQVDIAKDMAVALKMAADPVKEKVVANLSKRAAEMLQDAMDSLGPVRVRDVEAAQGRIITVIRSMEEKGEIVVARANGGDTLV